jgi:hypothetical protein
MKMFDIPGGQWMKSAQSKGVFDWAAWNSETSYYVQVKSNKPPGPPERKDIEDDQLPPCARRLIAIVYDGHAGKKKRVEFFGFGADEDHSFWYRLSDGKEMCW